SLWTQLIPKKSSVSSKRSHPPTAALTLKIYPRHVALKSKHVFAKNSTFQSSTMISTVPPSSRRQLLTTPCKLLANSFPRYGSSSRVLAQPDTQSPAC